MQLTGKDGQTTNGEGPLSAKAEKRDAAHHIKYGVLLMLL
jgi:hypothetical protein